MLCTTRDFWLEIHLYDQHQFTRIFKNNKHFMTFHQPQGITITNCVVVIQGVPVKVVFSRGYLGRPFLIQFLHSWWQMNGKGWRFYLQVEF